jgi:hypothetical protein
LAYVTILVGLAQAIGAVAMLVGIRAVIGVDPVELSWRGTDAQQLEQYMLAEEKKL